MSEHTGSNQQENVASDIISDIERRVSEMGDGDSKVLLGPLPGPAKADWTDDDDSGGTGDPTWGK